MSTDQQENSPERQRAAFANWCKHYNLTNAGEYDDLGTSATKTKMTQRPGIMRMWADAADDIFDVVWAEETSRASRDMIETLQLQEHLTTLGIPFVDGHEDPRAQYDPMYRKIITAIKGGIAEAETKRMSIRVRDTMTNRMQAGQYCGQKMPPGLKWNHDGIFIDEATADLARRTFELFAEVRSYSGTATRLNAEGYIGARGCQFSLSKVKKILQHPAYRGSYLWNGQSIAIPAPEVIDPALLPTVDELMSQIKARPQRTTNAEAVFAGLVRCRECGRWLASSVGRDNRRSARCRAANTPPYACGNRRSTTERKIERALLPRIVLELRERAEDVILGATPKRKVLEIDRKVARIEEAKRREMDLYVDQHRTKEELNRKFGELDAMKADLLSQKQEPAEMTVEMLRKAAKQIEKQWPVANGALKRTMLQTMITHIVLDPDDIANSQIIWRKGR